MEIYMIEQDNLTMKTELFLYEAWHLYTMFWSHDDYDNAKNSLSLTSNIDEFEQCEFRDTETMRDLLSKEDFEEWGLLCKRQ
jgi:hypothetical protein